MHVTVPTLVATKTKTLKLRVSQAELNDWQENAKAAGLSMSEWIRMRCNEMPIGTVFSMPSVNVINPEKMVLDGPSLRDVGEHLGRKPCKHGLLFCKKCA